MLRANIARMAIFPVGKHIHVHKFTPGNTNKILVPDSLISSSNLIER